MDSVTQAVLGAAVGQAVAGRTLGRRAALWGGAAGLVPDLDVLAAVVLGARGEFLYHRGPTHSLLVCLVLGLLWGEAAWRRRRASRRDRPAGGAPPATRTTWMLLFTAALVTHPLLDWFTSYGTQLLWPFTDHRFALNGVAIIDPFYTGVLLIGIALAWRGTRPWAPRAALAVSTAYLVVGLGLNGAAEHAVAGHLAAERAAVGTPAPATSAEVRCYPTLFQPVLRRVVVRDEGGFRVGSYTHLAPGDVRLHRVTPSRDARVQQLLDTPLGRTFHWFAMGVVSGRVTAQGAVVEIDDLRYGIPSGPPELGLWYLTARFDGHGHRVGDVERHRRSLPAPVSTLLARFWKALLGEPITDANAVPKATR